MLILNEHNVSREELAHFGLETLAYIKPVIINGRHVHIIHAADGTPLSMAADRDLAFVTILRHEMSPVSLH